MQIETRNGHLAAETFGADDAPTLVLAMGATASMIWWPDDFCHGLAASGLRVVRFDSRDTGQSTTCPPGAPDYAVEDLADDLIAVLDGVGVASAHVMGMSLGGYVGQMAALRSPDRIRSLILFASEPLGWTGAPLPGMDDRFLSHFAGFADLDWADPGAVVTFRVEIARLCAGSGYRFDESATAAMLGADHERAASPASAFNHGMLQVRGDWSDAAERLALPVLVLHGTEDPILPVQNGRALAGTIPNARLVEFPGLGHEIPQPLIPRLVAEVAGFVTSLP